MMLAVSWADATVLGTVIVMIAVTIMVIVEHAVPARGATAAIAPRKLDAIEEDILAIRADLADIKESLAELDRLFKSVG
jgi:hypothetical protein